MRRAVAILAVVGAACGGDDDRAVRVFAASSLTGAFSAIETSFEATHPGVDVVLSVAGSPTLREQILEGAPADVFAAADEPTMTALVDAGAVDGPPVVFARNQLTVAVPAGNPAGVRGLADLARPDLLVGLCAAGVPCGDLARAVLDRAGVQAVVDTDEPNVRALTTKIVDGELDVGLVYVTEVFDVDGLDALRIAKEDSIVVSYPIATLAGAGDDADAFVDFVVGREGRRILAEHGFGVP